MQPLNNIDTSLCCHRSALTPSSNQQPPPLADNQPLSPSQRTTLERLVVRIISLSQQKSVEIWAGLRRETGVKNNSELLNSHFQAAEQFLNARLAQVQNALGTRQLLQRISQLLPRGNNRQAVSNFIRQEYGHTVLSSLTKIQLQHVLTLLQKGQLAIPKPYHNTTTDRTLLPAEHVALNQQIAKLAAATGECPLHLQTSLLQLVGLKLGDPTPSRDFPLLLQYLQARQILSQHTAPTLQLLETWLKQPLDHHEQQMLVCYIKQHFQAVPLSILSPAQTQDVLNLLFTHRAGKLPEPQLVSENSVMTQIRYFPLISTLLPLWQMLTRHRRFSVSIIVILMILLWLFF